MYNKLIIWKLHIKFMKLLHIINVNLMFIYYNKYLKIIILNINKIYINEQLRKKEKLWYKLRLKWIEYALLKITIAKR